jgi:hypothetical protein
MWFHNSTIIAATAANIIIITATGIRTLSNRVYYGSLHPVLGLLLVDKVSYFHLANVLALLKIKKYDNS